VWEIIPNPGRIRIYTSGCPKNQKRCWYKIGSPPPDGSKNEVLKFRSVSNIVMAPARTGRDRRRRTAVIRTDHTKSGIESKVKEEDRIFMMVVMKLMAPKIEEAPARCRLKIARSTEIPEWYKFLANGGYTVQPVPAPIPANAERDKRVRDGGRSQNLMLFIRGKAISCAPIIIGTNQFPKPPIMMGITIKKIMTKA
jgi:hypothetical protein